MSKMKIISTPIFVACLLSISVLLVGGSLYWTMATQSIIQQNNSLALSKGPTSMSAGSTATDRRDYDTAVPKSVTETSPNSEQSDEGESLPATASSNQASGEQSSSKETQAQAEGTQAEGSQTQTEGSQTQSDESQSQLTGSQSAAESSSSPSGTPQMPAARTQSTTGIQVAGIMSEDLLPTPSPGSSETPVHSYYDANGNPPTAPGLAMRPRQFQPENGKMVYLTFDDGPYPSTTLKILAILAKENVQGTFFDVGHQVELNPDLLKAEYEQGNAIGNHTYSHNMAEVYKSPQAFLSDVKKAEDIIYNTIGIRPQIVRAPGGTVGNFNINYFNAVDAAGYLMEDWNVDSGDTDARLVPEAQLIHNVEQQIQGKSRVVILMHDLVGKSTTIQALPIIIEMLRKQDFAFGMLGSHVRPIVFPEGLHN